MKFARLVWANLKRRKIRTLLTLASILVAFILFGYLAAIRQALTAGIDVAGADRLVVRHKVSIIQPLPGSYEADIEQIVHIQLRYLKDRLAVRRLTLEVSDEAAALLARKGYDPTYGARPLKRVIQREINDPLAMALLSGQYTDGDTVRVEVAGERGCVPFDLGADVHMDDADAAGGNAW